MSEMISFLVLKSTASKLTIGSIFGYSSDGKDYQVTKVDDYDDVFVRIYGEEVTDDEA
ncbi:hypothetical protein GPK34_01070 [Secundilactobacillus kimchicus]|uniref:hypothetical protein n=1 Tax=Secundilactobacillus kimchicus TaxID=528209 RepID=UPI001C0166F2|nr:hypothetical protein [Secundilactobacillus kimchicus]MBT9670629.1 hypothetical protein [Secundilactobacillus kimchicus]